MSTSYLFVLGKILYNLYALYRTNIYQQKRKNNMDKALETFHKLVMLFPSVMILFWKTEPMGGR